MELSVGERRVLSIAPAVEPWVVVWADKEQRGDWFTERVACWALIEDDDSVLGARVVAVTGEDVHDHWPSFDRIDDQMIAVIPQSDVEAKRTELVEAAAEYYDREERVQAAIDEETAERKRERWAESKLRSIKAGPKRKTKRETKAKSAPRERTRRTKSQPISQGRRRDNI